MRLLILTQKVDRDDPILGFFHRWLVEFSKHCESIHVICLYEGKHTLPESVTVHSLGKERGGNRLLYIVRFYIYIFSLRAQYDAVFVHMNAEYVVLGGLIWRVLRKKVGLWYTHGHVSWYLRVAEKLSNIIFTASRDSFRLVSEKVRVMGHGIDTEVFTPRENHKERKGPLKLLSVGRLSPVKGIETAIKAVGRIVALGLDAELSIVGGAGTPEDKAYVQKLKSLAEHDKLAGRVRFLGAISPGDVPSVMQKADIFLHMSKTGSLDKVVIEAMSTGLIPLSSSEAFRDLLAGYTDMLMFTDGNDVELSQKIQKLNTMDIEKYSGLSSEMRKRVVEKHNIVRLIDAVAGTY